MFVKKNLPDTIASICLLQVGGDAHSFDQFNNANLGFLTTLSAKTNPNQVTLGGVCQDSSAVLSNAGADAPNATVVAKMCAVESPGTVVRDGEAMAISAGQFQLSVEIDRWHWCGCGQHEGRFLEFNLNIAVPDGYKISKDNSTTMPLKINLGTNDSFIMVSSKVSIRTESRNCTVLFLQ